MAPDLRPPATPTKRPGSTTSDDELKMWIQAFSLNFHLGLEPPKDYSPKKSDRIEDRCLARIRFLFHKGAVKPAVLEFRVQSEILYKGWVDKPKADRGLLPEKTRSGPQPISERERDQLLECLEGILKVKADECKEALSKSPRSVREATSGQERSSGFNDQPIQFGLTPAPKEAKRPRDEAFPNITAKRPRIPDLPPQMGPPDRGRPQQQGPTTRSANASFNSFVSDAPSIFSRPSFGNSYLVSTQETVPDHNYPSFQSQETREQFIVPQPDKSRSSDYASSSFEARVGGVPEEDILNESFEARQRSPTGHVNEELSQDLWDNLEIGSTERDLLDRLQRVFYELPATLRYASFRVRYEITRVFLYAGVRMSDDDFPTLGPVSFEEYDALWKFLQNHKSLREKPFPEKCGQDIWDIASDELQFRQGFRGIVLSGAITFNADAGGPFFQFKLEPMKLDLSHRLDRRFGHDRFLELDIPQLDGRFVPRFLKDLRGRGRDIIINWLIGGQSTPGHLFVGSQWKPFFVKPKDRKDRKQVFWKESSDDVEEAAVAHRLFFFAVDGVDFTAGGHQAIEIPELLESIRPTWLNKKQPFLKLFSRTALALSRNSATVILEPQQIHRVPDLLFESKVMTDGAGRLSQSLAYKINNQLGLSYLPSGFQGRIGEAKGLWTVDVNDERPGDWIELYASQCKWEPDPNQDNVHNRTFEVIRWSGPLKSAALNLQFLPLLVDRAISPDRMQAVLADLLKGGVNREIESLQEAMGDPLSFRKWLRENNSNIDDRLKNGAVPYRAGLPVTTEERLNMMLDAGFDPKKLHFMNDLARRAFKNKGDELKKKLNITVGKSTYAYMVPDFSGVLEPNEVFIDFSSFIDNVSGFAGVHLKGVDVLVARSPAHYASDIQKVRAVFKEELMGLKDVIVFSTKGNPSLAEKLSGGDYDGDIAWVCWEPSIVENFETAPMQDCPKLVEEKLIRQNKDTYQELVASQRHMDPTTILLRESFKFNMKQSMLGICTVFKEHVCYTQQKHDTPELLYLNTLLSHLVDQWKNGYLFAEDDWTEFKDKVVGFTPNYPKYKTDELDSNAEHVIDRLKYVADRAVHKALTDLEQGNPDPPRWDSDLVIYYKWAKEKAVSEPQWKELLGRLDQDVRDVKAQWGALWGKQKRDKNGDLSDEAMGKYMSLVDKVYPSFQAILPHVDTPLTQALLPSCLPDQELSDWALLRASALFASYATNKSLIQRFVWCMAGRELTRLKTIYAGGGIPPAVTRSMYAMLKPDGAYVKRARARVIGTGNGLVFDENMSVANADEVEALDDDD